MTPVRSVLSGCRGVVGLVPQPLCMKFKSAEADWNTLVVAHGYGSCNVPFANLVRLDGSTNTGNERNGVELSTHNLVRAVRQAGHSPVTNECHLLRVLGGLDL